MASDYYIRRDRWRQALDTDVLRPFSTRLVGGLLGSMCSHERPVAWPSQQQLARMLGCSDRTIRTAISDLEAEGYIQVVSRGNRNPATGEGRASRYRPIFEKANNFSLGDCGKNFSDGSEFFANRKQASTAKRKLTSTAKRKLTSTESSNKRRSDAALAASVDSPPPPRPAAGNNLNNFPPEFSEFYALAQNYGKAGNAAKETVFDAYRVALTYEGVTAETLYDRYDEHMEASQNRRYSGHIVMRWLNDPKNYAGTGRANGKPVATNETKKDRRASASKPGAKKGKPTAETAADESPHVVGPPKPAKAQYAEDRASKFFDPPNDPRSISSRLDYLREVELFEISDAKALMREFEVTRLRELVASDGDHSRCHKFVSRLAEAVRLKSPDWRERIIEKKMAR